MFCIIHKIVLAKLVNRVERINLNPFCTKFIIHDYNIVST